VKIVSNKLVSKMNTAGLEEHFVRYVFEEEGQQKQYDAHIKAKIGNDPHYLVQALAEVELGEELILKMKKAGVKSYIVSPASASTKSRRSKRATTKTPIGALARCLRTRCPKLYGRNTVASMARQARPHVGVE
jgi:hypothetical protein